jgi:phage portal protein BeeE
VESSDKPSLDQLEPLMRRAVEALDELAKVVANRTGLPSEAVRLAEAVSDARSNLYTELIRQGWIPPHEVPDGIDLDERLSHEGLGDSYNAQSQASD